MIAGQLEIQLLANMARLQSDMDAAKRMVGGAMGEIEKMASMAKAALGALGVGLSAGAFVSWVRGAIEAADSLNDLSKSTGIAVEQLSGLKLAAQQSGADLEGTAQAINKLSMKMGENAEKYAKIGVTAKEPLEAFKQLADIFSKIDDPQARAAFGAEALGKNWAAAAPLLAEGSAGIQEMVDKGARLSGMTQEAADQADAFNDRLAELQTISGAAALGIAKDVLPILTAVAEDMIDSKDGTEDLAGAFPKLSEALRAFVVFGGNVMFVLKAIGTEIGGIAAQAVAVASGNFKMAGDIGDMMKEDAEKARAAFDKWEAKMLSVGATATETAERVVKASEKQTAAEKSGVATFIAGEKEKKAAKSAPETAYESFAADASKRQALLMAEVGGVTKLTDAEKWALETMVKVRDGKLGQSDAERKLIGERVAAVVALEKLNAEEKRAADIEIQALARRADAIDADQTKAQSNIDGTTALREQSSELGLTSAALAALKQARIDDQIALESWRLGLLGGSEAAGTQADAIRETIAALEDRKIAMQENDRAQKAADAIKAQGEAWKSIEDTAHQTFVSIFDSGKSAFDRLKDTLKNGLLDLLYQMTLKKWIFNIAASVSGSAAAESAFGTAATGTTSSLGSAGNVLSGAKTAYDMFSSGASTTYTKLAESGIGQSLGLSTEQAAGYMAPVYDSTGALISEGSGTAAGGLTPLGSSVGSGLASMGAGILGSAIGSAIAGDYRVIKGISGSTVGAGIGAAVGSIFPVIGTAVGAVVGGILGGITDRAFGMGEKKQGETGLKGTFTGAQFAGSTYSKWTQKGGWFRSDDGGTDQSPLDSSISSALGASFALLKLETGRLAEGLGVDTANIAAYAKYISVAMTGDSAANAKALSDAMAGINNELAAVALSGTNFALTNETSSETLNRLYNSLLTVNQAFDAINISAYKASLASGDMASQLALAMGGLDAFKTSVTSYYDTYFSAAEKQADLTAQVTASFAAMGVAMPSTEAGLRAIVEGLDMTTASGRATFVSVMSVEQAFAQMTAANKALIDSAVSSRASIFDALSTDDQKLAAAKSRLDSGFSAIGERIPATAAAFIGLAERADVTTAAGQSLIAALSAMEPAFATVANAAKSAVDGLYAALGTIGAERSGLLDAIFSAQLDGMDSSGQVAALKSREAELWASLDGGNLDAASTLKDTLLQRIALEATAKDAATKAQLESAQTLLDTMKSVSAFSRSMRNEFLSLSASDLSPLSYADQLSASFTLWSETLAKAKTGDATAQSSLSSVGNSYLKEAQGYYGANSDYASAFSSVAGAMDQFGNTGPTDLAISDQQIIVTNLTKATTEQTNTSKEQVVALKSIDSALARQQSATEAQLRQNGEGLTAIIAALKKIDERLQSVEASNKQAALA